MSRSFDFDATDRFTAGAIGVPGERTFFIQAWSGADRCTLLAEKEQIAVLAQALLQLIDNLAETPEGVETPAADLELEEPLDAEWRAGEISIQYDEVADRIAILITEARPEDEDAHEQDVPETARFVMTRAQGRAMASHALEIVSAGRPRCQFCGYPIDAEGGHVCAAMNGHRSAPTED